MPTSVNVIDSTLRIVGELSKDTVRGLEEALAGLLLSVGGPAIVDLSGVSRICNDCVSPIVISAVHASETGRRMIVRASLDAYRKLCRVGADQVAQVELVDGGSDEAIASCQGDAA